MATGLYTRSSRIQVETRRPETCACFGSSGQDDRGIGCERIGIVRRRLPGCVHRHKYRLALVDQGECVLRYDNEAGKSDHRHLGAVEAPYQFTTIERLLEDFDADTQAYLDEHPGHR